MAKAIIQKAFNAGYLIEKYLPKLSKVLVNGFQNKQSPFAQGFIAGSQEMVNERVQSKSKFLARLQENIKNSPGKSTKQGKSKNRGDREIDIDI